MCWSSGDECGKHRREADEESLPGGRILVVRDSQVLFMDKLFYDTDMRKRTRFCSPGAWVRDVLDKLASMKRECSVAYKIQRGLRIDSLLLGVPVVYGILP